jgi:hypothetical protein
MGTLEFWPTSEGIHIVAIRDGVVRQVGWLWIKVRGIHHENL